MLPISVSIYCMNVEDTIEAALDSVVWADEIVVVDSGSTDRTIEIAKRKAHRVVVEPWRGYTEQNKYAVSLCRNDWVFVLDGDEECAPELAEEIRSLDDAQLEQVDVIYMRRRNWVMGRYVRSWSPDWQSRLINRHRVIWGDHVLHVARKPSHPTRILRLQGCLLHRRHINEGFREFFHGARDDARIVMVARHMYANGRRCRWTDLVFRPSLTFVKFYLLKQSWRDGLFGFMIAQKAAQGVRLKYSALWAIQNGIEPAEDD